MTDLHYLCRARRHDWHVVDGAKACRRCGHQFGRSNPKPATASPSTAAAQEDAGNRGSATVGGADRTPPASDLSPASAASTDLGARLARLSATWGSGAGALSPNQGATTPTPTPTPTPASSSDVTIEGSDLGKLVDWLGPLGPDAIVALEAKLIRRFDREPGEPDPEWLQKMRLSTTALLRKHLPDVTIGPGLGLILSSLAVGLGMLATSEPIARPELPERAPAAAASPPAAARHLKLVPPPPPVSPSTTDAPAQSAPTPEPVAAFGSGSSSANRSPFATLATTTPPSPGDANNAAIPEPA